MINISHVAKEDIFQVHGLLKEAGYVLMPEFDEIKDYGFVAKKDSEVIGFVWVLTNRKSAYIDYFVIKKDFPDDVIGENNHRKVSVSLMLKVLKFISNLGVVKIYGYLPNNHIGDKLALTYQSLGIQLTSTKYGICGDLRTVILNLQGMAYGEHDQNRNT